MEKNEKEMAGRMDYFVWNNIHTQQYLHPHPPVFGAIELRMLLKLKVIIFVSLQYIFALMQVLTLIEDSISANIRDIIL